MIEISQYKYFKLWIQQYLHKPVKGIFILFYNLIFCKPSKLQRLKYLIFDIKRLCRESNYVRLWLRCELGSRHYLNKKFGHFNII